MSRLQLTVKETFEMSELQNNTVIVLLTYFTLNKKGQNGQLHKTLLHVKFYS
jgi:hypothetical protein